MWYLIYLYLRLALFCGFHGYVYRLTNKWCRDTKSQGGTRQPYHARRELLAWKLHKILFTKKGYHSCPSCYWTTEKPNEHIEDKNSWCYEASLPQCPSCRMPLYPEDKECRYCVLDKDIEEGIQQEAEYQKEMDRQRDAWQDRMDALMDEDDSCDGSQYYRRVVFIKPSAGIFSTDNPQSDAMQIKAEQHCGSPACRHCN
jgi:uncharacterized Zn finger protein (UPF0148 family)